MLGAGTEGAPCAQTVREAANVAIATNGKASCRVNELDLTACLIYSLRALANSKGTAARSNMAAGVAGALANLNFLRNPEILTSS